MFYMRSAVLFLFITALFITCQNASLIRGHQSYFYSLLPCSLLAVKRMSYMRRQILFLFITALFITCRTHVLYMAASPISILYFSVHYLPNVGLCLICGSKSYFYSLLLCLLLAKRMYYMRWQVLFLFNTALLITCRQIHVL